MNGDLPAGWAKATLDIIGKSCSGGTPSRRCPEYFGRGIPWVKSGDLTDGPILKTDEEITNTGLENSAAKLMPVGTISMALYGATIGKLGVMTFPAATNQACVNLIPNSNVVVPRYVFFFLLSERRNFIEQGQGGAQPNISQEIVRSHPFFFPPLPEQKRIVAKVEKLLEKVDASQARLEKIATILKRFRQSVLAAACSGRLTADWRAENPKNADASALVAELELAHEKAGGHKRGNAATPSGEAHDLTLDGLPDSWRMTEMRTVVCPDRPITYGILKPGPDTPNGVLYVRVADYPNDKLNLATIRRTTKEIEKAFARARLKEGDILLSIRGTVGRVCVVPRELNDANITQDTARLSVQPALNADYVLWYLRATPTQNRMQKAVKGAAVRGINIGDVRALQMPVPPLPEQAEIVRRVEELFALADRLEARVGKARGQVDKLTQSILAKAFRGELVPQDPNDEPAEKLLARIRAATGPVAVQGGKVATTSSVRRGRPRKAR